MNSLIQFKIADILPDKSDVLKSQGVDENAETHDRIGVIVTEALNLFIENAKPVGKIKKISIKEFDLIFKGEGQNENNTPIGEIFLHADNLSLFSLTIGSEISFQINRLFNANDFALASLLDSVASLAADKSVEIIENLYQEELKKINKTNDSNRVLSYSPGYCGWHISSQRKLFEYLEPDEIGINLNESYLMIPLKSVSGVLIDAKENTTALKLDFRSVLTVKLFLVKTE